MFRRTSPMPSLTVTELRAALDRLLTEIESEFGEELTFELDHYWDVLVPDAFDLSSEPEVLAGQVSDDVESVRDFSRSDSDEHVSIWHECEHLAGVLRALAQKDESRM